MAAELGTVAAAALASVAPPGRPIAEAIRHRALFLICLLLILALWTSYYLQIKRIRPLHETVVSICAGIFVGLVVRLAGTWPNYSRNVGEYSWPASATSARRVDIVREE